MKNSSKTAILIAVMIFQILLPVLMITYDDITEKYASDKGEVFRFRLEQIVCTEYDVRFSVENNSVWGVRYAIVENDSEGFAVMTRSKGRPACVNYVESKGDSFYFPVSSIRTDMFEGKLKMLTMYDDDWYVKTGLDGWKETSFTDAYLEAYVYKGEVVPIAVYVEGKPLEEFVADLNLS